MADSDEPYQNVRSADLLGPFIGARVVDITQQDAEEFAETRETYVALHFDNGATLRFPIGDDGFDIIDIEFGEEGSYMIPAGKGLPKYADDAALNQIRGKAMVGHQSIEDVWTLLDHLQLLEHILDKEVDPGDGLGPEGWRHFAEVESAKFKKSE